MDQGLHLELAKRPMSVCCQLEGQRGSRPQAVVMHTSTRHAVALCVQWRA